MTTAAAASAGLLRRRRPEEEEVEMEVEVEADVEAAEAAGAEAAGAEVEAAAETAAEAEAEAEAEARPQTARLASSSAEMRGDRDEIARRSGEVRRRSAAERGMEGVGSGEGWGALPYGCSSRGRRPRASSWAYCCMRSLASRAWWSQGARVRVKIRVRG